MDMCAAHTLLFVPPLQVARQYEEEGWVDPTSFANLPTEQEELQQVRARGWLMTAGPHLLRWFTK
jgi:DNA-binding IclR family transcriptional regulator